MISAVVLEAGLVFSRAATPRISACTTSSVIGFIGGSQYGFFLSLFALIAAQVRQNVANPRQRKNL
jgi:hypothetical protein